MFAVACDLDSDRLTASHVFRYLSGLLVCSHLPILADLHALLETSTSPQPAPPDGIRSTPGSACTTLSPPPPLVLHLHPHFFLLTMLSLSPPTLTASPSSQTSSRANPRPRCTSPGSAPARATCTAPGTSSSASGRASRRSSRPRSASAPARTAGAATRCGPRSQRARDPTSYLCESPRACDHGVRRAHARGSARACVQDGAERDGRHGAVPADEGRLWTHGLLADLQPQS